MEKKFIVGICLIVSGIFTGGFFCLGYYITDLIDQAMYYEIVEKSGAWYEIVDIETGENLMTKVQGQNAVHQYLDEHEDIMQRVEELVNNKMLEDWKTA